jgi:hypothetical protein
MLIFGRRPQWLRVLLVPSQEFVQVEQLLPDGDSNPSNDLQITDPVTLRFDAGYEIDPVAMTGHPIERVIEGTVRPDGSVLFAATATQVNQLIQDCGALSRQVRLTIGNQTWGAGYFEIDGEW